jgi:hypothetical protein
MVFEEIVNPTPQEFSQALTVLTDAFWPTPLFSQYLFPRRKALTRMFLETQFIFSLKAGRVFAAKDEYGSIVACALWSIPNTPDFSFQTALRLGLGWKTAWLTLRAPLAARRIAELFHLLDRYAPDRPFVTLEFLASARKGAGAELVRRSMAAFPGQTLYVESIVSKNDHAFYRQFGFEPFARVDFHGTDYVFMLLSSKADTPA